MSAYRTSLLISISALSLTLVFGASSRSRADWPANGAPVCRALGRQMQPRLIADAEGGVILVWEDLRTTYADIYAQRLDALGNPRWSGDGVAVCNAFLGQSNPVLVTDGANGAIIVWVDLRIGNAELYAQRIDASGRPLWARNGVAVCTSEPGEIRPVAVSDGTGGAIIAWVDFRGPDCDIYAQRVDGTGVAQWQDNGVPVCTAARCQSNLQMTAAGDGGLLVWEDSRADSLGHPNDLYAQRIDASGRALWTKDGRIVSNARESKEPTQLVPDGTGGAVITWQTTSPRSRVQRLDAAGNRVWGDAGLSVCAVQSLLQRDPAVAADRDGGFVVVWQDVRDATSGRVYAQRFDAAGARTWPAEGVPLSSGDNQWWPRVVGTGQGVSVSWVAGVTLYTQKVNRAADLLWRPNGLGVCTGSVANFDHTMVSTSTGAALVAWEDNRGDGGDIYAQQLERLTAIVVREFDIYETPTTLMLSWKLASDAATVLQSVGIRRASSADGPWRCLVTLNGSDPIEFEDHDVRPHEAYWYDLVLVAANGARYVTSPIRVEFNGRARTTALFAPRVLPEGTVEVRYFLGAPSAIRLEMFAVSGKRIGVLVQGNDGPGEHRVTWDRHDAAGLRVPAGIYILRLRSGSEVYSRKLPLVP